MIHFPCSISHHGCFWNFNANILISRYICIHSGMEKRVGRGRPARFLIEGEGNVYSQERMSRYRW